MDRTPSNLWETYMQEEFQQDEVDKLSDANYHRMVLMLEEYDNVAYIIRNKYTSCKPSDDEMCRFIEKVYHKFNQKVFHGYLNLEKLEIIKYKSNDKNISRFPYHIILDGELILDNDFKLYLIHKFESICFLHKLKRILS